MLCASRQRSRLRFFSQKSPPLCLAAARSSRLRAGGLTSFELHPPAWLITLLAGIFVAFEVLRSTYRLYVTERNRREAYETQKIPSMTLAELVEHIVGTDDWKRSGSATKGFGCLGGNSKEGRSGFVVNVGF
jgi:hypothetical protein